MRSNGLIVFVPKYGIEGPVYLEDSAAAAAAAADGGTGPGSGSGRKQGAVAAAAESNYVYDEEKQVGAVQQLFVLAQLWSPCRSSCDACLHCRSPASEMRLLSRSPALQTVRSKDGSTHYTVFDKCAVRCELATVARHSWGPASWRFWLCSCRS